MKTLKYMKYVIVVLLTLSSLCVFGVWHWSKNKVEPSVLVEKKEIQTISAINQVEVPREYTTYTSEIKFMKNYFTGIQTVNYVHEFNRAVDEILIKLYLNKPKQEVQETQNRPEIEQYTSKVVEEEQVYLTKVLVNGENTSFTQDGANAWIKLSKPLESGQSISIGMEFQGSLMRQKDGSMYAYNILPQVAVFNDSTGWAEENYNIEENSYLEVADYNLITVVPSDLFPICTGNITEKYETEDGNMKYTYEAKKVRGMGIYLDEPLKEYNLENEDGVDVVVYSDRMLDKDIILMREQEVFKYYANIFGRYPYDRFVIIDREEEAPIAYPQMAILDLDKADTHYEMMYSVIGKQWLPYIIGHEPQKDIWLNVGLEAYLAKRRTNSIETMKKYLENLKPDAYKKKNEESKYEENYYVNAYITPMKLFLEIEDTIGTQAWEACLREYYQKKSFKLSQYKEFISIILQNNGNTRWLLDDYSYPVINGKEERQ